LKVVGVLQIIVADSGVPGLLAGHQRLSWFCVPHHLEAFLRIDVSHTHPSRSALLPAALKTGLERPRRIRNRDFDRCQQLGRWCFRPGPCASKRGPKKSCGSSGRRRCCGTRVRASATARSSTLRELRRARAGSAAAAFRFFNNSPGDGGRVNRHRWGPHFAGSSAALA